MASPIYSQIAANRRRTVVLIALFILIIIGFGWLLGIFFEDRMGMLLVAALFSLAMTAGSFYAGDKIALWTAGARETSRDENPYLHRIVENLAITAGIPKPKVFLIPEAAINAFATGLNPERASVAVTSGAIERLANEELEGVLAHELSHIKNFDIRVMMVVIVLVGMIALLADWFLRLHFFQGRGDRDRAIHPVFLLAGLILAILMPLVAQLIKLAVSRKREYLADASGALLTRYPEGLARALEKIAADKRPLRRATEATAHLYIANPFGGKRQILTRLFSTHPPVEDRVRILRSMA